MQIQVRHRQKEKKEKKKKEGLLWVSWGIAGENESGEIWGRNLLGFLFMFLSNKVMHLIYTSSPCFLLADLVQPWLKGDEHPPGSVEWTQQLVLFQPYGWKLSQSQPGRTEWPFKTFNSHKGGNERKKKNSSLKLQLTMSVNTVRLPFPTKGIK